ncbi:MtrB/PioB family decaheme-associated outer membrane protein [Shewanella cyperi]|uniref:MtrB/PioB family decaheme-associated outer membrane protein n=1 Tax=Shewanella cyperi TaxID=2814292 RepID=A0A974XJ70_9GAMM|nr:MtrB/PioB family decaheme-associated outer membrane protein [Shewanella cyperi]QSX29365.1 MtrB/PioB family decaheme-associated outer membrane protein [Shewanella cyperi]
MKTSKLASWILLALYGALPLCASAADDDEKSDFYDIPYETTRLVEFTNWIDIGTKYIFDDSLRYGQFNGESEKGLSAILNGHIFSLNTEDEDKARFYEMDLRDLGTDAQQLQLAFGSQGTYKVNLDYQENYYRELFMNGAQSLYHAAWGTTNLGEPGSELGEVDSALSRQNLELGLNWDFLEHWNLALSYNQTDKDGSRTRGIYGGPVFLAEAIDSLTTELTTKLQYLGSHYQFSVGYLYSGYENNFDFQDITVLSKGKSIASRLGVDPDNQFHQVNADLLYNLGDNTRVQLYAAKGKARQNAQFLAASINADIEQPADSLNGEVDYRDLKFYLNHRFSSAVGVNLLARDTDRDNRTAPLDITYVMIDGTAPAKGNPYSTMPLSWSEREYAIDAYWRINQLVKLSAGAQTKAFERTSSVAKESDTDKLWLRVNLSPVTSVDAELKVSREDREANEYIAPETSVFGQPINPLLRQRHKGDVETDRLQLNLRYNPSAEFSIGLMGDYKDLSYGEPDNFGVKNSKTKSYSLDFAYMPTAQSQITVYAGRNEYDEDQYGERNGTWRVFFADAANVYGLNAKWELVEDSLALEADVNYTDINQDLDSRILTGDDAGTEKDYGLVDSREVWATVTLIYRLDPTAEVRLGYEHMTYDNNDEQYFQLDDVVGAFSNLALADSVDTVSLSYKKFF